MHVPSDDLRCVARAHEHLVSCLEELTDECAHRPSRLPTWSVGHVLTHLARNADSHVRRARAAIRGDVVDQYDGAATGRNVEIDLGATRGARVLVADVTESAHAVELAWRLVPPSSWNNVTRDTTGTPRPLVELPQRRLIEVEVHLLDTGLAGSHRDWPEDFVEQTLADARSSLERRHRDWPTVTFSHPADELAWIFGRLQGNGIPPAPPWH